MVLRLVLGILTAVLLPLGLAFVVIGLLIEEPDRGRPEDFVYVGAPLALAGLAVAAAFVVLQRREAGRRRRRRAGLRTQAEVVRAELNHNVRSGGSVALRLTVRFAGAGGVDGTVSGTFLAPPSSRPEEGARIDILYDPAEPSNFEPALRG